MEAVRSRPDGLSPQRLAPPEEIDSIERGIPTLTAGVYRSSSQLLMARFSFCGTWEEALPGLKLFGLDEMKRGSKNYQFARKEIERKRELATFHNASPAGQYPPEELSDFGFSEIWSGGIYLIWDRVAVREPRIVWYERQHWQEFADLLEFFRYLALGTPITTP
jgi:hypothetical protein